MNQCRMYRGDIEYVNTTISIRRDLRDFAKENHISMSGLVGEILEQVRSRRNQP